MFDPDLYLLCLASRLVGPQQVLDGIVRAAGAAASAPTTTQQIPSSAVSNAASHHHQSLASPTLTTTVLYWESSPLVLPSVSSSTATTTTVMNGQREVVLLNLTFEIGVAVPRPFLSSSQLPSAAAPATTPPTPTLLIHAYYGCLLQDGTYWRQPHPLSPLNLRRQLHDELGWDLDEGSSMRLAENTATALQQYPINIRNEQGAHFKLRNLPIEEEEQEMGSQQQHQQDSEDDDDSSNDDDNPEEWVQDTSRFEYCARLPYPVAKSSSWIGVGHEPAPLPERLQMDVLVRQCEWIQQHQGHGERRRAVVNEEGVDPLLVTDDDIQPVLDAWKNHRAILHGRASSQQQQHQSALLQRRAAATAEGPAPTGSTTATTTTVVGDMGAQSAQQMSPHPREGQLGSSGHGPSRAKPPHRRPTPTSTATAFQRKTKKKKPKLAGYD